jgi:hypothetical protein
VYGCSVVLAYESILESIMTVWHIPVFRILRDGVYGRKRIGTGPSVNRYSIGVPVYVMDKNERTRRTPLPTLPQPLCCSMH